MIEQNYVVLDLEMTGLHPKQDAILEVGAARIRGGRVEDTLSFFVNPGRPIPKEVSALTGITEEMAATGVSSQEAIQRVAAFVQEDIWVGHNIIFDYSFLKQLAVNEKISFEKKAIDTLKLARMFMEEPRQKNLDSLCTYLGITCKKHHRALSDALATHELYQYLVEKFGTEHAKSFAAQDLIYKPKRQTPATKVQKMHLKELADYHKIELDVSVENLTRSEASRLVDRLISQYGRMPRKTQT